MSDIGGYFPREFTEGIRRTDDPEEAAVRFAGWLAESDHAEVGEVALPGEREAAGAVPAEGMERTDDRDGQGTDGYGDDAGGGGYHSADEAAMAGDRASEVLREARVAVGELAGDAEVRRAPGLPEAIDRIAEAIDALRRTVTAQLEELKQGRGGGSLPVVAVVQHTTAHGAAEDAEFSAAPNARLQAILRLITRRLDQAGKWLWSMIVHLVTIREWSLGGKLRVPGFIEASINVTFGGTGGAAEPSSDP